jgi:hypothetical protein
MHNIEGKRRGMQMPSSGNLKAQRPISGQNDARKVVFFPAKFYA